MVSFEHVIENEMKCLKVLSKGIYEVKLEVLI
jgi:hypothetical protein